MRILGKAAQFTKLTNQVNSIGLAIATLTFLLEKMKTDQQTPRLCQKYQGNTAKDMKMSVEGKMQFNISIFLSFHFFDDTITMHSGLFVIWQGGFAYFAKKPYLWGIAMSHLKGTFKRHKWTQTKMPTASAIIFRNSHFVILFHIL